MEMELGCMAELTRLREGQMAETVTISLSR